MILVEEAEKIILNHTKDFDSEDIPLFDSIGRILAEDLITDRDLPPFNRATVDGIAISFKDYLDGIRKFKIKGVQAAGQTPINIDRKGQCIEIMTGAAVNKNLDTVIPYEDLIIQNGQAIVQEVPVQKDQNIHPQGSDKIKGEILVKKDNIITPTILGVSASIGKVKIKVKKLPRILIITTGDELVPMDSNPTDYQIRQSNAINIQAELKKYKIQAHAMHLKDNREMIETKLKSNLQHYDVILLTGAVSMGKFDYIPEVLKNLNVQKFFHKVKQRPGKPFWFGKSQESTLIFAFPGNPVSAFLCLHRYFIPWLEASLNLVRQVEFAKLDIDLNFKPELQYFAQVKLLVNEKAELIASMMNTNGSGDYSHLPDTNAFIELPWDKTRFSKGECYRIWRYNN